MKVVIGSGAQVRAFPRENPSALPRPIAWRDFFESQNFKSAEKKKKTKRHLVQEKINKMFVSLSRAALTSSSSSSFLLVCVLFNQGVIDSVSAADTGTGGVKTSMTGASHARHQLTHRSSVLEKNKAEMPPSRRHLRLRV